MTEHDLQLVANAKTLYSGETAERNVLSPEIVWHVPGHNPVSGEYRGRAYFEEMPARMAPLDRWDFEVLQVMVNGNYVVAHFRAIGERKGKTIDTYGSHLLRFDAEGKIGEGWGFVEKQDALDEFFKT